MEIDKAILIACGLLSIISGLGYALAKIDESARKKDEKRFAMGLAYTFLQNKKIKYVFIILAISIGIIFLLSGLGVFDS